MQSSSLRFFRSALFGALACAVASCAARKDVSEDDDRLRPLSDPSHGFDPSWPTFDVGSWPNIDASLGSYDGPSWSDYEHVTDGKFTTPYEWTVATKLDGRYAHMYMEVRLVGESPRLYFINDWHRNKEGPIHAKCFNRFDFFSPQTHEAILVRVYGDHHIEVYWNGQDVTGKSTGVAGFGPSADLSTPHSIFEFEMPAPSPGAWMAVLGDPRDKVPVVPIGSTIESACEDPAYLIDEPTVGNMKVSAAGLTSVDAAPIVPMAFAFDKYRVVPGDKVILRARELGDAPGTVTLVDGAGKMVPAEVVDWTPTRVSFTVPSGLVGDPITVRLRLPMKSMSGSGSSGTPFPSGDIQAPALCVCAKLEGCACRKPPAQFTSGLGAK